MTLNPTLALVNIDVDFNVNDWKHISRRKISLGHKMTAKHILYFSQRKLPFAKNFKEVEIMVRPGVIIESLKFICPVCKTELTTDKCSKCGQLIDCDDFEVDVCPAEVLTDHRDVETNNGMDTF